MDNRSDDFMHEVEEQLQWERFEKLFKDYGIYIIGAVLAVILSVATYVYIGHARETKQQALSEAFFNSLSFLSKGQTEKALEGLKEISQDESNYAMMSGLQRAAILVDKPDTKAQGVAVYREMIESKSIDRRYRNLAIIFLCLAELDTGDSKELAKLLQDASVGMNMWPSMTAELSAIVAIKNGDVEQARELLTKLKDDEATPQGTHVRALALLQTLPQTK